MKKRIDVVLLIVLAMVCLWPAMAEGQCDMVVRDSLPFVENFEGWTAGVSGPFGSCWTRVCTSGEFYSGPFVKNQYELVGGQSVQNKSVYFNVSPGDEWSAAQVEYVALPEMENVRELTVDFRVKRTNAHVGIEVGVMEGSDTGTFVAVERYAPMPTGSWVGYSVALTPYDGEGSRIAFRALATGSQVGQVYLDDIEVWYDSCAAPCCLMVSASETEEGCYELEWLSANEGGEFGLTLAGVDTTTVSGNHYTTPVLEAMTEYTVSLRAECEGGDSVEYVTTFQTPVSALPWEEHFDTLVMPAGWRMIGGGGVGLNTVLYYDGIAALQFVEGVNDNVAVLPTFPLALGDLYINLFMRPTGINLWGSGELDVGYVTDIENAGSFHSVATFRREEFPGSDYGERHVLFGEAPAGARMALRYRGSTYYGDWLVDNIEVGDARCLAPWVREVDSIGSTGVRLVWQPVAEGAEYLVAMGGDTTSTADTVLRLTALTPDSVYVARLARICESGDTSAWVSMDFRTECAMLTHGDMPYVEDFESGIDPCMRLLKPGGYNSGNRPEVRYEGGSNALSIGLYGATAPNYVVLPAVDTLAGLTLAFSTYTDIRDKVYEVGVMTDHEDIATFIPVASFAPVDNGMWERWELPLTDSVEGHYVAIKVDRAEGEWEYEECLLDYVTLTTTDPCPQLVAVVVDSVEGTSAWVRVDDRMGRSHYRLTLTSSYDTVVVDSVGGAYVFTDLVPATSYIVEARAYCADGEMTRAVRVAFGTECAVVQPPYRENFNQTHRGELPRCWKVWPYEAVMPPHVVDSLSADEVHASCDGSASLLMETGLFRTADYAVLPQMDLTEDSLEMRLWYRYEDANMGELTVGYIVGYPADVYMPGAEFVFHEVEVLPADAGVGTMAVVALDSVPDTATHIVLRWSYSGWPYAVNIDDIEIARRQADMPQVCEVPTGLRVVAVDSTEATVAWMPVGDEEEWEIAFGGGGEWSVRTSDTFYTATGLTPGTAYSVRVRALCSDMMVSEFTEEVTFTTRMHEVGIGRVESSVLTLCPNPASGQVVLQGLREVAEVEVMDMNGRGWMRCRLDGDRAVMDLSVLPQGAYFVKVVQAAKVAVLKLIVR